MGLIHCARCARAVPLSAQRLCPHCRRIFHEGCGRRREVSGARLDGYLLCVCLTCSGTRPSPDAFADASGWRFDAPHADAS